MGSAYRGRTGGCTFVHPERNRLCESSLKRPLTRGHTSSSDDRASRSTPSGRELNHVHHTVFDMCGIVGYVGPKAASPLLIEGLKRLEYRGYDSAGISTMNGKGLDTRKAKGKISQLEAVMNGNPAHGTIGIAHTRWATHGQPNECNAHPHLDCHGKIAVVHNGIIENFGALRTMLVRQGHTFVSETDTEVLAHLIEAALGDGPLEDAVIDALNLVTGTYGIAVISADEPDKIVCARKGSPLLIGVGDGEYFVASDASAILAHTRQVVYLDDGEMGVITRKGYEVLD